MAISGNHDSAQRLGFASRLIDAAGVHLRTAPATVGVPVMLADEHGPVYAVPYSDPEAVADPGQLPARSHEAALGEAMARVREDLGRRGHATRSVALAHAFVAGGQPSESEARHQRRRRRPGCPCRRSTASTTSPRATCTGGRS